MPKNNNALDYFGQFPKEFAEHFLYCHTKPFELVFDPFVSSRTLIDACKKMLRHFIMTDLKPHLAWTEIRKFDVNEGLPKWLPNVDMIFLDPPYIQQAKDQYSDSPNALTNMVREKFYQVFLIC